MINTTSNFENLITLYQSEVEILKQQNAILEREGYDISVATERIKTLEDVLDYVTLNSEMVYSLSQLRAELHFPRTVVEARLALEVRIEERIRRL